MIGDMIGELTEKIVGQRVIHRRYSELKIVI